jgi:predicted CXXCH cytochrome family protein
VYVNACDSCHGLVDAAAHRFEALRERNETCSLCHVVEVPAGSMLHQPFAEGDCLACHDPHGGEEVAILRGQSYADSCKACHEDVTGAHDVVHGPVSAGACGACHEPHASQAPKLLMEEGRALCLRCHVTTGYEIDSMPLVHEPALGECLVCHDPHATDNAAILASDTLTLCTGCHAEISTTVDSAPTQHDAVTTERSCLNCHAAHATSHAGLLKGETQTLCFECHDKVIELEDGTKLANMKALLENRRSLHGAIAQDSCVACHEIHGGGHRRLLTNEYPSDLYYPFSENAYALCFGCHDRQLALLSRTGSVTAFRNGETNLHYIHVNRDEKGRTCSVCHDAHAADAEKHIRDEIPFGPAGWMLPIRYERLEEGGRCGPGCHQSFEYNRLRPLTYPPIDDAEAWRGRDLVPGVPAQEPRRKRNNRTHARPASRPDRRNHETA